MADLLLTYDSNERYYDIQFADDGDFVMTDGFDTAILMTVFGEQRADSSEVVRSEYRRGDWSNELNDIEDYQVGSKYWLLDQARANQQSLNKSIEYLEQGFSWMITDSLLKSVEVSGTISYRGIANEVTLTTPDDVVSTKLFNSWELTGN